MSTTKGLQFKKIDLHIHTPASGDYNDKTATATDIVDRAVAQGLAAIAITDHQTAANVDAIKDAAKDKGLVVFPGVELMVAGGESGVHINLIFDVDKDTNHITQFLNTLKVYCSKDGKPTVAAETTVGRVADELWQYDRSAIVILAHCHSSKGVTGDIKGETRTQIFQSLRHNILGAEASESNFTNDDLKAKHKRVIDVFDGTDKDYNYRKLGIFQASDAHSLDQIGTTPSWFKVDDPITIEDIRQCLIDRDTRLRQTFEFTPTPYPRIESLVVTSGFLKDQAFDFHEGLNSLLGAKGSGKSLAIEALRFGLDQSPTLTPIKDDHWTKLDKCVKPYGSVQIVIIDESGKKYQITRTYNASDSHPFQITDLSDGSKKQFGVSELFPVLFLSQNEIIRIAEDQSGASLRTFIDRFFDFHNYQHRIAAITKELEAVDRKLADSLRAHLSLGQATAKAGTLKEEIERINRQLTNTTFDRYSKAEATGREIKAHADFVAGLQNEVAGLERTYTDRRPPAISTDPDPSIKRAAESSVIALTTIKENLIDVRTSLADIKKTVDAEYSQWEGQFAPIKTEYETLVKETGGNQGMLDQKRRKLLADLAVVEREMSATDVKARGLRPAAEGRNEILNRLDAAYKEYFDERSRRSEFFTTQSKGSIEVSIAAGRDVSQFREKLLGVKKGSYVREDDIDQLVKAITPRELVSAALSYEFKNRQDKKPIEDLAAAKGIRFDMLERLISHLFSAMEYEELLALMYETAPQDVPEISYEVAGVLKPLTELSVGQKAAALLIIGLSDGRFPIVIDQPEDSLDLRSIWDDVCLTLRDSKERRQFVFTTHNSSVAVASDSDKFTILEAKATHAEILYSGSMNSKTIKSEVIAYLEGGPETYEKKRAKYNL